MSIFIQNQMEKASGCIDAFDRIAAHMGGIEYINDKLQALNAGDDAIITPEEAALLSHALGAALYLSLASAQQKQAQGQPDTRLPHDGEGRFH